MKTKLLWLFLLVMFDFSAAAQGPVLRDGNILRVYIGPSEPAGVRIFVGTTTSTSPNADSGTPWDQTTENPTVVHFSKQVRVINPGDPCLIEPSLNIPCVDTGWVNIPVPYNRIEVPVGSGNWVFDKDMRINIHTADMSLGYCGFVQCGAVLVLPRMKLSDIVVINKQRSVGVSR